MLKRLCRSLVLSLALLIVGFLPFQPSWRGSSSTAIPFLTVKSVCAKYLNVNSFGAQGDGIHNDSTAIAAAMAAARSGDTILFPPGIYICNDVNVTNKSNLTIKGKGN